VVPTTLVIGLNFTMVLYLAIGVSLVMFQIPKKLMATYIKLNHSVYIFTYVNCFQIII